MVHSSEGCSPPQRRPSLLPQDEHWQGPCLELKENLLINCGGTKVNVEIDFSPKVRCCMPFQKNDFQSIPRKFSFLAAGERRRQASWNGERCRGSHFPSVYPGRK